MRNFEYYVYNNIDNCVYRLDLLSEKPINKSLDFWINANTGYHFLHETFNSKSAFLRYLNDMNQATANSYTKSFLIAPPYYVKQSYQVETNVLSTSITAYGGIYTFTAEEGLIGCENGTEFEKFLFMNRGQRFDVCYLIRIHKFILNSKIVRPVIDEERALPRIFGDILFNVVLGTGDKTTARIDKSSGFSLTLTVALTIRSLRLMELKKQVFKDS